MDSLKLLSDVENTIDPTAPERIRQARAKLLNGLEKPRRRPRTRFALGLGGLGLAAAGTAIVLAFTAGTVVLPLSYAIPAASAAEALEMAVESTLDGVSAADTTLRPGQYLRIEVTRDYLWTDGSATDEPSREAAFTHRDTENLYVPADRSDAWVLEIRPSEVTGTYGPGGQKLLNSVKPGADRVAGVQSFPAGLRDYGGSTQPLDRFRDSYDEMPRDPKQLLQWFINTNGEYASMAILDAIYMNLPPADLRAAMLGALAESGDFTLVSADATTATLERRGDWGTQQFTIDTHSGLIISVTDARRHTDDVVPEGTPELRETFALSIVDSAPAATR